MMPHSCAMPGCDADATGVFCSRHYFLLPAKDARWLARLQILIARTDDDETRRHLREQLAGYTSTAIRTLQKTEASTSSQATPDSARPSSSSRWTGATYPEARHG